MGGLRHRLHGADDAGCHWFCALITARDPKQQNISPKLYTLVLWIVPAASIVVAAIVYPVNLGCQMDITFYMELLMGVKKHKIAHLYKKWELCYNALSK